MVGGPRWTALLFCLCLLAAGVAVPAGGVAGGGVTPGLQQSVDADEVRIAIALQEDGTAEWTVEYRVRLADDNETAAFESLAADVAKNESAYVDRFATRIRATVADAENATGREMAASNFSVDTEKRNLPEQYGVLTYRFRWDGFAAVDGDRLSTAGTLPGLFLTERQTLEVAWPEGYELAEDARPEPDTVNERSVVWAGPISFGPDGPAVVVAPAGGLTAPLALAGVLALVAVVAGVWLYRNRGVDPHDGAGATADAPAATGEGVEGGTDEGTADPPPELLSNEERVLALLENRGGRIKQQEVVEELDWTAAKTSQVVTDMREDGQIDVFRLGRENVIKLPDADLGIADGEDEADGDGE